MNDKILPSGIWEPRSADDAIALYRDWAATYEADILGQGYVTPARLAAALAGLSGPETAVLDFGCGTGLSGQALRAAGFTTVDGTDITREMLDLAASKGLYRRLWLSQAGTPVASPGTYGAIIAAGVVSLGAAPPETLGLLLAALAPGGLLAFSYNDPTLRDPGYVGALESALAQGTAQLAFREHGPHLPDKGMGADAIILRRA